MNRHICAVLVFFLSHSVYADMAAMHKEAFLPVYSVGFEQLEWQKNQQEGAMLAWDFFASLRAGADHWLLKSKGNASRRDTEKNEIQALYIKPVSAFLDVQLGVHSQVEPELQQYALFGIKGVMPYFIEMNQYLLLGADGDAIAFIELDYDWHLTQNWVLRTDASFLFNAKNNSELYTGSGFSEAEQGLRFAWHRYRLWVPYVGVEWERYYGKTAKMREAVDMPNQDWRAVLGVHLKY